MKLENRLPKNFDEIKKELKSSFMEGPRFSNNSLFQIERFNLGSHQSDERRYRQICLELSQSIKSIGKYEIDKRRNELKCLDLERQIKGSHSDHQRDLLICDLDELILEMDYSEKLLLDATVEFAYLYGEFKKSKKYTSEDFENSELHYWEKRLVRDAQSQVLERGSIQEGTIKALHLIGRNPVLDQLELRKEHLLIQQEKEPS